MKKKEVSFKKEVCLGIQEGSGKLWKDTRGKGAAGTPDEQQVEKYKIRSRQSGGQKETQEHPVVVLRLGLETSRNLEQG